MALKFVLLIKMAILSQEESREVLNGQEIWDIQLAMSLGLLILFYCLSEQLKDKYIYLMIVVSN